MRGRRFSACVAALASVLAGAGCYTYTAVDTPARGSEVRVVIPVTTGVEGSRSAPESSSMEGTVVTAGDTLVLEARSTQQIDAFQTFTVVDTLRMARSRLLSVEERRLSRPRTVAFAIGSTVGAFLMFKAFQVITGGDEGDGPPGNGGEASHIIREILRFTVPLPGR